MHGAYDMEERLGRQGSREICPRCGGAKTSGEKCSTCAYPYHKDLRQMTVAQILNDV